MRNLNQQILDTVELYINDLKINGPFDRTEPAIVTAVNDSTHYNVSINGVVYESIPFLLGNTLSVSDSVWVRIPKNQKENMYIDRRRK